MNTKKNSWIGLSIRLPTEFTYDDLEPIRDGNPFITEDQMKE